MTPPSATIIQATRFMRHAVPQARKIVLDIFRNMTKDESRSTHQIYAECHKIEASLPSHFLPQSPYKERLARVSLPDRPEHPIRSIRYLKLVVLKDLENRKIICKTITKRPPRDEELAEHKQRIERLRRQNKRNGIESESLLSVAPTEVDDWKWQLTPRGAKLLASTEDVRGITGELETEFDHLSVDQLAKLSMGVDLLQEVESELPPRNHMKSKRTQRLWRQKAQQAREMQEVKANEDNPARLLVDDKRKQAVHERLPHQNSDNSRLAAQSAGLDMHETEEKLPNVPRLYSSTGNSRSARTILTKPKDESWRLLDPRRTKLNNQDDDNS